MMVAHACSKAERASSSVSSMICLFKKERIADRHRQVIERAEAGKEPFEHRLVGDVDAFAACAVAGRASASCTLSTEREAIVTLAPLAKAALA